MNNKLQRNCTIAEQIRRSVAVLLQCGGVPVYAEERIITEVAFLRQDRALEIRYVIFMGRNV